MRLQYGDKMKILRKTIQEKKKKKKKKTNMKKPPQKDNLLYQKKC